MLELLWGSTTQPLDPARFIRLQQHALLTLEGAESQGVMPCQRLESAETDQDAIGSRTPLIYNQSSRIGVMSPAYVDKDGEELPCRDLTLMLRFFKEKAAPLQLTTLLIPVIQNKNVGENHIRLLELQFMYHNGDPVLTSMKYYDSKPKGPFSAPSQPVFDKINAVFETRDLSLEDKYLQHQSATNRTDCGYYVFNYIMQRFMNKTAALRNPRFTAEDMQGLYALSASAPELKAPVANELDDSSKGVQNLAQSRAELRASVSSISTAPETTSISPSVLYGLVFLAVTVAVTTAVLMQQSYVGNIARMSCDVAGSKRLAQMLTILAGGLLAETAVGCATYKCYQPSIQNETPLVSATRDSVESRRSSSYEMV